MGAHQQRNYRNVQTRHSGRSTPEDHATRHHPHLDGRMAGSPVQGGRTKSPHHGVHWRLARWQGERQHTRETYSEEFSIPTHSPGGTSIDPGQETHTQWMLITSKLRHKKHALGRSSNALTVARREHPARDCPRPQDTMATSLEHRTIPVPQSRKLQQRSSTPEQFKQRNWGTLDEPTTPSTPSQGREGSGR